MYVKRVIIHGSQRHPRPAQCAVTQQFLDRIDEIWQGRGFNSRSEYIRYVLHDAADHQTFDRDELLALARAERQLREDTTHSFEDVLAQSDLDGDHADE